MDSSTNDVHVDLVKFLLSKLPFRRKASSQWQFTSLETLLDDSPSRLPRQYAMLKRMKDVWRRAVLEVPHTWLSTDLNAAEVDGNIATLNLGLTLSYCTVSPLSTDAVIDRQDTADCVAPNFCLTKQRSGLHYTYYNTVGIKIHPPKHLEDLFQHCTQTASDVMMYGHDEALATYSISGIFVGIPGCSMSRNTQTCLPPSSLRACIVDPQPIEFSVLANPIGSSSPEGLSREKALYISIRRPALLLGMKGPMGWQNCETGKSLQELMIGMSINAEASLDIIYNAWQYRYRNDPVCPPLPDDLIIFGILYDSSQLHIIAHVVREESHSSSNPQRYISYLVDSLEFPAYPNGQGAARWFTGRLRVLLALLTLQKHVHRLGALWGDVSCSMSSEMLWFSTTQGPDATEMDPSHNQAGVSAFRSSLLGVLDDFVMGPDIRYRYPPSNKSDAELSEEDLSYEHASDEDTASQVTAGHQEEHKGL